MVNKRIYNVTVTLTEAVNMPQKCPLVEVAGCEWHDALMVVQSRNDGQPDLARYCTTTTSITSC